MKRYVIAFGAMILLLGGLFFFNIGSGSVKMTGSEIADILLHRFGSTADETARQIVWEIRLPRICAAVILGERSQLRDFCCSHFSESDCGSLCAWHLIRGEACGCADDDHPSGNGQDDQFARHDCGGVCRIDACDGVRALNFLPGKKMSMLVVCGIMIGYICSAITDFCVTFADDSNIVNLHNWSMGSSPE